MKYSMIRYNGTPQGKVEWSVIRGGKVVAEGVADNIEQARTSSEKAVLEAFNAEKVVSTVLCDLHESGLSLLKSTK